MEKNEFLEILKNTYFNYGEKQMYNALYKAIKERDLDYFSKENDNGYSMESLLQEQMEDTNVTHMSNMFLINLINTYMDCISRKEQPENLVEKILLDCGDNAKNTLYNIMRKKINNVSTKDDHMEKFNIPEEEEFLDRIIQIMHEEFIKEINSSYFLQNLKQQIKTKKFYLTTAKNCAILSGIKDKNLRNVEKTSDNKRLRAVSTIGNLRTEQQDAAIIMTHPKNKNIKLLAVCDGMGGLKNGALASHILAKEFGKWFIERGRDLVKCNDSDLQEIINHELHILNDIAREKIQALTLPEEQAGSTLVAAIVYKGEAIIINVGDSRGYAIKGGQFKQITKDQSYSQVLFDAVYGSDESYPQVTRDDMRFHVRNNISAPAFFTREDFKADVTKLHKGEFDSLILCSDGITDCLSNEEISYISTNVKQNEIAKYLVLAANSKLTPMPNKLLGLLGMSREFIRPGKDNSTVATYGGDER